MVYFGKNRYLVVGEFRQLGSVFKLLNVHDLNCIESLGSPVLTFIYVSVLSLAYFF